MASQTKVYDSQKLFGQVYTPNFIVNKILDDIGFNSEKILGKKILDPACGDGRFLEEVVRRIIKFSSVENLKDNLQNVYGWDIDGGAIELCIDNLNTLINKFGIKVEWNIYKNDSIKEIETTQNNLFFLEVDNKKFDFIVGNPPYIRIQHLEETQRKYIQRNYKFCQSGSTDIYIAFFELCYHLLNENGICGLITPNTFFYSETAKAMRNSFSKLGIIKQITNYGIIQLFDNVTTYSAILIFDKKKHKTFLYQQATDKENFISRKILTNEIINQKIWQLSVEKNNKQHGVKLKDICKIHVGVTTLYDKAYIFPIQQMDEKYVFAFTKLKGKIKIEKEIMKPIIKGSTLKSSQDKISEYILFPYTKVHGKHQIIPEEKLKMDFPLAYDYLLSIKDELAKRDNGRPIVPWYAFGRTQSLDTSWGKKIIFSPMNIKPNFILYENEECTFYSGYCIKYNGDYNKLLKQLNSEEMEKFISVSSRDFRGGWKAYNKKIIEDFIINAEEL